jgi:hypothetical protein
MNPIRLYLTFIFFILLWIPAFSQAVQVTLIPGLARAGFMANATAFLGKGNLKIETGPEAGFFTRNGFMAGGKIGLTKVIDECNWYYTTHHPTYFLYLIYDYSFNRKQHVPGAGLGTHIALTDNMYISPEISFRYFQPRFINNLFTGLGLKLTYGDNLNFKRSKRSHFW